MTASRYWTRQQNHTRHSCFGHLLAVTAAAAVTLSSCGQPTSDDGARVQERLWGTTSTSWQDPARVAASLGAARAVRINARTNYLTYYENGTPLSKWKVATARPGKETPKGIFAVHAKDVCPPWSLGGVSAAPCAPNNPLGKKALWFESGYTYGMHGVNEAGLWSVTADNPRDRDQSAGCVRNHPENIDWLFERVSVGTPVVVGLWDTDPAVVDCSGHAALCGGVPPSDGDGDDNGEDNTGDSLLPTTLPQWCSVNVSAEPGSYANVRASSSTSSAVVATLDRQSRIRVESEAKGQVVGGSDDWYYVTFTLGGDKAGYIHSSLIDCTR